MTRRRRPDATTSTNESNCAGLWALVAQLLYKSHLAADEQSREPSVEDTIAVEEHFAAIGRLEKTVTSLREKSGDAGTRSGLMSLDESSAAVNELLELPMHLIERVVNQGGEITSNEIRCALSPDRKLAAGHAQVNAHLEEIALLVMTVRLVNDHVTSCNAVVRGLETRQSLSYGLLNGGGTGYVVERDLHRHVHGRSLARDNRDRVSLCRSRAGSRPETDSQRPCVGKHHNGPEKIGSSPSQASTPNCQDLGAGVDGLR
jgi:hypothetical protein